MGTPTAVVMGGHDEFQVSVNAVGIPGVADGDMGHDMALMPGNHISQQPNCIYIIDRERIITGIQ